LPVSKAFEEGSELRGRSLQTTVLHDRRI
jgi:hypothetical protein